MRLERVMKYVTPVIVAGFLAACSTGAGMPEPELTFQHIQALPVNVAKVETDVKPGADVDGFVISPTTASERYLDSRFKAVGTQGVLRATMLEASVRHVYAPAKQKLAGYLNVGGHDVYEVHLVLRLEHVADDGSVLYGNTIQATRTMNITEHASVSEREQHELEGLEKIYADLDAQLVQIVMTQMRIGALQ